MRINSVLLILFIITIACEFPSQPEAAEEDTLVPEADPRQTAVLYVQQAAEYEALCHQGYQVAYDRMMLALQEDSFANPAVILDLDETVLDNSPYAAWQVSHNRPYDPESWQRWVALAQAEAVPGAASFLKAADCKGLRIFYLTNRQETGRDATLANLKKLGLPQADSSQLLMRTGTSHKAARRKMIRDKGYRIVLYIGDNLGDFKQLWDGQSTAERSDRVKEYRRALGRRFIILPNPVYGEWLEAVYKHRDDLRESAKDSIRRVILEEAAF